MILMPHFGNRIPEDGEYDGGGPADIERAVIHPCLPFAPLRADELESYEEGIPGPLDVPPQIVIASALTSTWKVSATLSAGSQSLSLTDEEFSISDPGGELSIGSRITATKAAQYAELNETSTSASGFLQLVIRAGRANFIKWSPTDDGLWVPGIEISVIAREDDEEGIVFFSSYGAYVTLCDTDHTAASVTCTVAGVSVPLYWDEIGNAYTLSGTITLEPTEWLGLAP